MLQSSNYYAILNVSRDATAEEIRSAYFELARRLHPDSNPNKDAVEQFLRVQEAYETLSTPEKRAVYESTLPIQEFAAPAISYQVCYSRPNLPRINEPQLVYALVDLTSVPDPGASINPPLNLCLVIDRSTSMQGERIEMVKANIQDLLQKLKPLDIISVVAYSDRAEVIIPATRYTDLSILQGKINQITTSGSTEMLNGLTAGVDQLRRSLSPAYINHLILLTDGRTYGDEEACLALAKEAAEDGICISGLGIGTEWNDIFLDKLVSYSGGSTLYISSPGDLATYLTQKYTSLYTIYAERVLFEFENDPVSRLEYALRVQPDVGVLGLESPVWAGNIPQFNSLRVLFEFMVHPIKPGVTEVRLAHGSIKMDIPTRVIPTAKLKLDLTLPVSDKATFGPPPQAIIDFLSNLTLYRMQEQARRDVQIGSLESAVGRLHRLASQLIAQGERDLAQTVLNEVQSLQQKHQYSKEGEKQLKYGTRGLFLPPGMETYLR